MTTDAELLRAYAEEKSEAAFGELVQRQVNLVYSVALRQCGGDASLAQDVTQRVFTDLARKARQLSSHAMLGGWLCRSACYAASDIVRVERSRRLREKEAQAMQDVSRPALTDADWKNLAPLLDQAVGELAERDRDAVVARFFEGKTFGEIGATLRLSEDAARMRVDRALEKLRTGLGRRGVTSTSAALGVALANQVAAAAPAGIAASIAGTALTVAAEAGATGAWVGFFAMSKLQTGAVALVIAAGILGVTLEFNTHRALAAELGQLQEQSRTLAALPPLRAPSSQAAVVSPPPTAAGGSRAGMPAARPVVYDEVAARLAALRAAGMKPSSEWENAGRATSEAAFETMLWAWHHGDYDVFATLIGFTDAAKAKLDAWFAALPASTRAKFGTPERIIAPAYVDMLPPFSNFKFLFPDRHKYEMGFKFLPPEPRSPKGRLMVQYAFRGPESFATAQTADGWKVSRWVESAVEMLTARIDPATGDLLPQKPQPAKP